MKRQHSLLSLLGLSLFASGPSLSAQVAPDDDDASRPVYNNGIHNFENGSTTGDGSGLGDWVFGRDADGNFDVASGSSNGGVGRIDVSDKSFRLWDADDSGHFIDVFRFFHGGDLGVGQTFSFQMDVNFRSGFKGFRLRDIDDSTNIFQFEVRDSGTEADYVVSNAATNNGSIGHDYSADTTFTLVFTQTSLTKGDWLITRSGGVTNTVSGTYEGRISSFQLYTFKAGSNPNNAILFNNFEVGP